jgi:hypothetical protein
LDIKIFFKLKTWNEGWMEKSFFNGVSEQQLLESLNSTTLALPWASFNNHVMESKQVTLFSYLKQNEDQGY